ncbi:MAG TPA: UvrD-helicase domain-containing protein [Gemmatimonadales bacterium]|jgi:DNA helicase-2/ATP-dependent DNA helicase PcrA|nr:UvrD-helicase domain-containing protein [Gemmatimonadales bacterium]
MTEDVRDSWLHSLNPAQAEAVEHVHGPLLVLAGAGSGKTRVLTTRIASLIERHGVPPDRIFAVTFTNKAAGEMKERIGRLLNRDPSGLWIGTFHSLGARVLRRDAALLGFTRQFTIYDQADSVSLVKRLLEQRGHSPKTFTPKVVQSIISGARNRMQSPADLRAESPFDRLAHVAADVQEAMGPALKAANAMDFDDLLLRPLELFREHPDRLEYYRHKFQFILVDEFQDTNKAQYELIRLLGRHGNVAAVGDDDQSIYGWRGADVRNMRQFQQDFGGTQLVRLEENYRSTRLVLDAANGVIAENAGRIGKMLRTSRQGGESLTLVAAADERDEAEWIVRELARRQGAAEWSYDEMAILYRTNAQSRAFEESFRRSGVPYRIIGATSFYARREVKDLLAYLRLAANPSDDEAFLRAINTPKRGIGDSTLAALVAQASAWGRTLLDTATRADAVPDLRPNVRNALRDFAGMVSRLHEAAATWTPAQLLEEVIRVADYEAWLRAEGPEGLDRLDNVRELVASAANWSEVVTPGAEDEGTPLERFLAEAALVSANDNIAGDERGVTLMTLHTAKGLEWPVVVIAGLEEGLFPLARSLEQLEGLEEERRLAYVGLTRAKDKLYLSWARARRRGGELRPGAPSRFLTAIPPGVIEERRTSALWAPDWDTGAVGGARRPSWGSRRASIPAPVPVVEEGSQDSPRYVKGERVHHRRFGAGTIQGLRGAGRDLKVSVTFDDAEVGTKELLVAYAGLERDWESA